MTREQKRSLLLIAAAAVLLIGLHFVPVTGWLKLVLYLIPYLLVGGETLVDACKGIYNRQPFDENLLMAVATIGAMVLGDYPEAVSVMLFYQIGELFESYAVGRSRRNIGDLMDIRPDYANVETADGVARVKPEQVAVGDTIVVKPGERVPLDGTVLTGTSALNMSALTGESAPVDVTEGSTVVSGSVNLSGVLRLRVEKVYAESTVARILELVENSSLKKAHTERFITKFARVYTPSVCGAALALAILPPVVRLIMGIPADWGEWIYRALTFLVISCPCALGLATPVAIMVGSGMGAKNGILFKTAVSLEETGKMDIVALDKTGTITSGEPRVTDVIPSGGVTEKELISLALSLEKKSEHPLAKAVLLYAKEQQVDAPEAADFQALPGNGLSGTLDGASLAGGSFSYISGHTTVSAQEQASFERLASEGKTPLCFMKNGRLAGMIAVADVIKEDSPQAVKELQNMGIRVVMLTGDNERTARAIGAQAGVDEVIAGVLPDGKESVIRSLKEQGKVAMVGDGINDAPALTRADIGIAIGAGTDIAIDAADVVLMKSRLSDVPAAIRLSRATLRNIHENLFWAFFYNVVGIPLAAGLWYPIFGWKLNPMFGAAAMSLSSFCVVTNALRLNLFKMHDASKDHPMRKRAEKTANKGGEKAENAGAVRMGAEDTRSIGQTANGNETVSKEMQKSENQKNNINMEGITMTKTMNIEGMMCGHCEARVKKALEALAGVESAEVSHEKGTAVVSMSADVADDTLKEAVEAQDYKVDSIQ